MNILASLSETDRLCNDDTSYVKEQAATQAFMQFVGSNFKELVEAYDRQQNVIRLPDGCISPKDGYWGQTYVQVDDPLGIDHNLDFSTLTVKENLPKIPSDLWAAWVHLCFHFVREYTMGTLEVSCRILQNEEDNTQFKIIVPRQKVTSVSVRTADFADSIDILTGEPIESYPLPGWRSYGSSHSHNLMAASPSSVDDKYELGDPGFHSIIGTINVAKMTYSLYTSITTNKTRYKIPIDSLIQIEKNETQFHPDVLKYIVVEPRTYGTYQTGAITTRYGKSTSTSWVNRKTYSPWNNPAHDDYDDAYFSSDPFHYESNPKKLDAPLYYADQEEIEMAYHVLMDSLKDAIHYVDTVQVKEIQKFAEDILEQVNNMFSEAK